MESDKELRAEIERLKKELSKQQRAYAALEERLTELEKPQKTWRPLTVKTLSNAIETK